MLALAAAGEICCWPGSISNNKPSDAVFSLAARLGVLAPLVIGAASGGGGAALFGDVKQAGSPLPCSAVRHSIGEALGRAWSVMGM